MATRTTLTWEEFLAAGEEWQRWEWVDGRIEFMSSVSLQHGHFLALLIGCLGSFCRAHSEWVAFGSNAVFTMSSGNWRMPDVSLVRRARFPGGAMPTKADFAPDVAFEIHSPSDSPGQIQRKRKDYQQNGVVQVWFDLEKRLVELVYPDRPLQYFEEYQPLVIDTLPDFSLDLKELYSA
jgi:Uma2 family endonuclease